MAAEVSIEKVRYTIKQAYKKLKGTQVGSVMVDEGQTLEQALVEAQRQLSHLPSQLTAEHDD